MWTCESETPWTMIEHWWWNEAQREPTRPFPSGQVDNRAGWAGPPSPLVLSPLSALGSLLSSLVPTSRHGRRRRRAPRSPRPRRPRHPRQEVRLPPRPAPMLISPGGLLLIEIEIEIFPLFQDNQAPRGWGRAGRSFLEPRSPQGCMSQTVPTPSFLSLLLAAPVWCSCGSYWGISLVGVLLISDLCSFASSSYHVHTYRSSVLHLPLPFLMCCHFLAGGERWQLRGRAGCWWRIRQWFWWRCEFLSFSPSSALGLLYLCCIPSCHYCTQLFLLFLV